MVRKYPVGLLVFFWLLLVSVFPAFSAETGYGIPVTGKGLWLQQKTSENPAAYAETWDWYIACSGIMDDELLEKLDGKPIMMAFCSKTLTGFKKNVDRFEGRILGVVWDYEAINVNSGKPITRKKAEADLTAARDYVHAKGLPFGVVVQDDPENSLKKNGVDYHRADQFADFLMPMIYPQWWDNVSFYTWYNYQLEVAATAVPLLPLGAIETTSKKLTYKVLTPEDITKHYNLLHPPQPQGIGFWGAARLDESYLEAIDGLPY
jgi:hypothetical protein